VGGGFLIFKGMEKTILAILAGAILLLFSYSEPGFTQSGDEIKSLQKEIDALKEGQKRIQRDLESIKNFLRERQAQRARGPQAPQPFKPVVLNIGDDPFKGRRDAKVTIVDFSDYQ
jgi:protein-disulfide isomerase